MKQLPEPVARATHDLFAALPLGRAMGQLVVLDPQPPGVLALAEAAVTHRAVVAHPSLVAGLWLYVDELDRSHRVSQTLENGTGAFWHGIMHRREGDFGNSHYWFERVGAHPAAAAIKGYEPHGFIDAVQERHRQDAPDLVALQRKEWAALFAWCARNASA